MSPALRMHGLVALALLAAGTVGLAFGLGWAWWVAWLVSVNAVAILLYGWDKLVAGNDARRVPEALLQLVALGGGSPAAFLASTLFRHKARKASFRRVLVAIVALQLVLVGAWLFWYLSRP
jgi:uncharacterized membrane protein YsdA (DUF1294 family)